MGLGQTDLAILLRNTVLWEEQAGHGLSLKLGIAVGKQHCPGSHFLSTCVQHDGIPQLRPRLFHSTKISTLSGKCLS